jgi:SAM-dependent methyltransferase
MDLTMNHSVSDPFAVRDWDEHWRRLVSRGQLSGVKRERVDYWDDLAGDYQVYVAKIEVMPALPILEPYLSKKKSLIDVGCGPGHEISHLAARVSRVVAIEPSSKMLCHAPKLSNVSYIQKRWQEVDTEAAEFVYSSQVVNFMPDACDFILRMERHATERCFLHVLDDFGSRFLDDLYTVLTGHRRLRSARFVDLYNLMRFMGIRPVVVPVAGLPPVTWENSDAAIIDCRRRLGAAWKEDVAIPWMRAHLRSGPEGHVLLGNERPTAVAHWQPRRAATNP